MKTITTLFLVLASLCNYSQIQDTTSEMKKKSAQNTIEITKLELYYINRQKETRFRLTNDDLKKSSMVSHRIIYDKMLFLEITNEITTNLKKAPYDDNSIDVRMVCEINFSDGSIKTISFDRSDNIFYDGTKYKKNDKLLKLLLNYYNF